MDNNNSTALIRIETPRFTEVEVLEPEAVDPRQGMINALARAVVAAQQAPKLSDAEQVRAWAEAFDEWLHVDPKTGDPRPAATVNAYSDAWRDFRQFCRKEARFVDGLDIRDWVADLRTRPIAVSVARGLIRNGRRQAGQMGLSPTTVNQWIAGISSFYSFCQNFHVRTVDGQTVALLEGPNPAKSHAVKRPKTKRLGKEVAWLAAEQLDAVLRGIRSARTLGDLERGVASDVRSIIETRDYALLLTYVMTVARNREVREWQWKHLVRRGDTMFYEWDNKSKDGTDELPAPCWLAVQDYLRLAGRLSSMQPDDFVFQPTGDSATRLKRPDGSPVIEAGEWNRNRAISAQEANRRLRRYCEKAGIVADHVHIHSLRHSGIMLYLKGGAPVERVSRRAHHSSLDMTMHYTHEMEGQRNVDWQSAANLLGL